MEYLANLDATSTSIDCEETLMRGKVGLVIGLAAGYVLGTRAGRERYEQIKAQAAKVWERDSVQKQVAKVSAFGRSALNSVPGVVWEGAKKVTSAASGSGSVQERANRAASAAKSSAQDVAEAVDESVDEAEKAGEEHGGAKSTGAGASASNTGS